MTTPPGATREVPASFRRHVFALRLLRLLPWLTGAMLIATTAAALVLFRMQNAPMAVLPPMLGVAMLVFVSLVLLKPLLRDALDKAQAAKTMFESGRVVPMRLEPGGWSDMQGSYYLLHGDKGAQAVSMRFHRRGFGSLREGEPVEAYVDPTGASPLFGFVVGSFTGWGERVDAAAIRQNWRRFRWQLTLLGVLVACSVFVPAWLLRQDWNRHEADAVLAQASRGWPEVPATILESALGETWISRKNGKGRDRGYEAVIRYRYAVAGKEYEGRGVRVALAPSRDPAPVRALLADFPVGAAVAVRHDPARPEVAYLLPGGEADALGLADDARVNLLVMLGLAGLVLAMLAAGLRWLDRRVRRFLRRCRETGIPDMGLDA